MQLSQEADIATRCRQGDRNAQRQLYETYAGWMLGVCLRYVSDQSTAEDLLHDGFVQIFTHFDQFHWRGEGSLKAWLFRVQQSIILQHLRRQSAHEFFLSIDENPELAEDIPEPEEVHTIPRQVLMRLIRELPVGYRTVFNLFVIDRHSHREIAQLLGINERSSASQLVHARRLLASKINEWRQQNQ